MSDSSEARSQRESLGCLGKGCLTLGGLFVLLAIALVAGVSWGIHYLRSYSTPEKAALSTVAFAAPSWAPRQDTVRLERDWKEFEEAAKHRQAVRIELTSNDINTLIAQSEAKDDVVVSIDNNIGRLQFSVPLNRLFMMNGRYLSGTATIQASSDGDPAKIRISNIIVNGRPVPESVLDQGFFGLPSIHTFVTNWLTRQRIASFQIENDKVIGETRGDD